MFRITDSCGLTGKYYDAEFIALGHKRTLQIYNANGWQRI